MFRITKRFAAIVRNVAKETGRYAISGVQFAVAGDHGVLVVTDGRRLAATTCMLTPADDMPEGQHAEPGLVPAKDFVELCKLDKARVRPGVTVTLKEPGFQGQNREGASLAGQQLDGNFPKWTDVVPQTPGLVEVTLNAAFLMGLLESVPVGDGGEPIVTLGVNGPDRPITLAARGSGRSWLGVQMPVNGAEGGYAEAYRETTGKPLSERYDQTVERAIVAARSKAAALLPEITPAALLRLRCSDDGHALADALEAFRTAVEGDEQWLYPAAEVEVTESQTQAA